MKPRTASERLKERIVYLERQLDKANADNEELRAENGGLKQRLEQMEWANVVRGTNARNLRQRGLM